MKSKSAYKSGGMFEGASHLIFENAKQLRRRMTDAENVLWLHLKNKIGNCKFRRQHPIGNYVADFYCHKAKLIIEVDGSVHNDREVKEQDEIRENDLMNMDYQIVRFTNEEVMKQCETVLKKISEIVNATIQNESSKSRV